MSHTRESTSVLDLLHSRYNYSDARLSEGTARRSKRNAEAEFEELKTTGALLEVHVSEGPKPVSSEWIDLEVEGQRIRGSTQAECPLRCWRLWRGPGDRLRPEVFPYSASFSVGPHIFIALRKKLGLFHANAEQAFIQSKLSKKSLGAIHRLQRSQRPNRQACTLALRSVTGGAPVPRASCASAIVSVWNDAQPTHVSRVRTEGGRRIETVLVVHVDDTIGPGNSGDYGRLHGHLKQAAPDEQARKRHTLHRLHLQTPSS